MEETDGTELLFYHFVYMLWAQNFQLVFLHSFKLSHVSASAKHCPVLFGSLAVLQGNTGQCIVTPLVSLTFN